MAKLRSLARTLLAGDEEDIDKDTEEDEEETEEEDTEEEGTEDEGEEEAAPPEGAFPAHAGLALLAEKIAAGEPLDQDDLAIIEQAKAEEGEETPEDMAAETPEVQAAEELLGVEEHAEEGEAPEGEAAPSVLEEHLEGDTPEDVQAAAEGLADALEDEAVTQEADIERLESEDEPDEDAIEASKQRAGILRALSKALLAGEW